MLDTLRDITIEPADLMVPDEPHSDYERVRRIIAFISERWREQPSLEAIADHVGLSTTHVHHLFRRWAGLSPKAFLQAITLDNAKVLLADSASVLDATYELGLSGPARLHDLFVTHEAMTPGDFKTGGSGLTMRFGFHPSPFGEALLIVTDRGLAGLGFVDDEDRAAALAEGGILRGPGRHGAGSPAHLQPVAMAGGAAAPGGADRHGFRGAGLADPAAHSPRPGHHLFRHRPPHRQARRSPSRRRGGGQEPDLLRGPLPPGARPLRRAHRLSLGAYPQAGDFGLGGGAEPERERSVETSAAKMHAHAFPS
jgi:AraC-like DNA-binding protein